MTRSNWTGAHDAYKGALAAEDLLVAQGAGTLGRDVILQAGHNVTIQDSFALIRLSRIPEAAEVIDEGVREG